MSGEGWEGLAYEIDSKLKFSLSYITKDVCK